LTVTVKHSKKGSNRSRKMVDI